MRVDNNALCRRSRGAEQSSPSTRHHAALSTDRAGAQVALCYQPAGKGEPFIFLNFTLGTYKPNARHHLWGEAPSSDVAAELNTHYRTS